MCRQTAVAFLSNGNHLRSHAMRNQAFNIQYPGMLSRQTPPPSKRTVLYPNCNTNPPYSPKPGYQRTLTARRSPTPYPRKLPALSRRPHPILLLHPTRRIPRHPRHILPRKARHPHIRIIRIAHRHLLLLLVLLRRWIPLPQSLDVFRCGVPDVESVVPGREGRFERVVEAVEGGNGEAEVGGEGGEGGGGEEGGRVRCLLRGGGE